MPPKNFSNALNKQRTATPTRNMGSLGVVGEVINPLREELERASEQLPIRLVPIEQLLDNPFQHLARPTLDEESLQELVTSIEQNDFYGALLARRKKGAGEHYELAFGHRRREAARRAGLKELPVKIVELSDLKMAQIMASENFSREDLTPLGEANVVGYFYTAQNMTIDQIAQVVGKKRGWVQPRLSLYEAPIDVKQMVEQRPETMSHARLLKEVKDVGERTSLIRQVLENGLTNEELKNHLDNHKKSDKKITSHSSAESSDKLHNASRENSALSERNTPSYDRTQRLNALDKLDKTAARFERLVSESDYRLTKAEKSTLSDIVERLSALLD